MFFSDKMKGAKTPFSPFENHYAYEFYHGRPPESELQRARAIRDEWMRQRQARKARKAEEAKRK